MGGGGPDGAKRKEGGSDIIQSGSQQDECRQRLGQKKPTGGEVQQRNINILIKARLTGEQRPQRPLPPSPEGVKGRPDYCFIVHNFMARAGEKLQFILK